MPSSGELSKDKRSLKLELKEMELAHEDVVRQLKLEQAKVTTMLRQEFEQNGKQAAGAVREEDEDATGGSGAAAQARDP